MRSCSLFSCGSGVAPVLAHRESESFLEELTEMVRIPVAAQRRNADDRSVGVPEKALDVFHLHPFDFRTDGCAGDLGEAKV